MRNNASFVYSFFLVIADFVAVLAAFVAAYIIRVQYDNRMLLAEVPGKTYLKIFLVLVPSWIIIFALMGLYNKDIYERKFHEFVRLMSGCIVGIMSIITADFVVDRPIFPARIVPVYAFLIAFSLLLLERTVLREIRKSFFNIGRGTIRAMIIGSSSTAKEMAELLMNTRHTGYNIVAMVGPNSIIPSEFNSHHYYNLEDALAHAKKLRLHTILQADLFSDDSKNIEIYDFAQANHLAYKFVPGKQALLGSSNTVELFHNFPVISVHQTPLVGWGRIAKRLADLLIASAGLILGLPLFLVIIAAIKLTDFRWPVIYRHKRVTRFGEEFYIYKFRSMYGKWSPGLGQPESKSPTQIFKEMGREDLVKDFKDKQKVDDDPRIMPVGKFIRKTGLDELPQLWNVIKGDVSVVGPRAIVADELQRYKNASSLFLSVKPGITGLWQVTDRSNKLSYDERSALELYYVQNWNFLLDLKILYRTVLVVLKGEGK